MDSSQVERTGPDAPASVRPRRTILAPLPDEAPPGAIPAEPHPEHGPGRPHDSRTPPRRGSIRSRATDGRRSRRRETNPRAARDEKPESSTKAYLWRRNVRFLDRLLMDMEDNGARPGDINRSVVLRAALSALEDAGMARELARCADEEELSQLIASRLARPGS